MFYNLNRLWDQGRLGLYALTDPGYWFIANLTLMLVALFGLVPYEVDPRMSAVEQGLVVMRRLLSTILVLVVAYPFLLHAGTPPVGAMELYGEPVHWWFSMLCNYAFGLVLGVIVGLVVRVTLIRYGSAWWSAYLKTWRVHQTDDAQSDIRQEVLHYTPAHFDPQRHYQTGKIFIGLTERGKPYYLDEAEFKAKHMEIIGPSGTGKGVALGVLLDQAIRRGWTIFAVDVKWGKGVPKLVHVVNQACEAAKRTFIFLDLNDEGPGHWEPFIHGTPDEATARLVAAFNLGATRDNSDVHKGAERGVIDELVEKTDRSVSALTAEAAKLFGDRDITPRLLSGLREFTKRKTFHVPSGSGSRGFSVEKSLRNNAVVYVRGSLFNHVVKDATRVFIIETMQTLVRLAPTLPAHVILYIDEINEVLCEPIITAMRTLREFGVTVLIAYQSVTDLRTLKRSDVDGRNAEAAFHTNCAHKLIYRAADAETAEWAARQSATKIIDVVRSEHTDINRAGAEVWSPARSLTPLEVPLIPENAFMAMPDRVAGMFAPGKLATVVKTHWVTVHKEYVPQWPKPASPAPKPKRKVANAAA